MSSPILCLAFLLYLANALVFNHPQKTPVGAVYTSGLSSAPQTTPSPKARKELLRRQDDISTTRIFADAKCGYYLENDAEGNPSTQGLDCPSDGDGSDPICVIQLPLSGEDFGHVGCMERSDIELGDVFSPTACVNSGISCDVSCPTDTMTTYCTDPVNQYCNTFLWASLPIVFITCGTISYSDGWERYLYTTIDGEDTSSEGQLFTTDIFLNNAAASSSTLLLSSNLPVVNTLNVSLTTTISVIQIEGTLLPATTNTSSTSQAAAIQSNSATANPQAKTSSQKSAPPIGAIVGGVIGGVGLIAIIAIAAFVIRKKYYNKSNTSSSQSPFTTLFSGGTGGNSEMDASEPVHKYEYPSYQPVPSELPSTDKASTLRSVSELTRGDSTARHSTLSSNWMPNSPASTHIGTMPPVIAEVQGSEVPMRNTGTPSISVYSPTSPKLVVNT